MTNGNVEPNALQASIKSVAQVGDKIEVVVRLSNKSTRALHYIADVRVIQYDAATRTLTLSLSDAGREVIPTTIGKLPSFRHIDPDSEAEIQLTVPNRVVKLSRTAPAGKIAFETQSLSEVEQIKTKIAWADVPYYTDTRPTKDKVTQMPAARWEKFQAEATKRLGKTKPRS